MLNLKIQIQKLLFEGKTDKEIIDAISVGVDDKSVVFKDEKVLNQNPPRTVKPTMYYNKHSGRKSWKERKPGRGRDRQQTREFKEV